MRHTKTIHHVRKLESLHYAGPEAVNEFQNLRRVFYIHGGGGGKEDLKNHILYLTFLFCKYDQKNFLLTRTDRLDIELKLYSVCHSYS